MSFQIIYVILYPKYDNLKQGRSTLNYMSIWNKENLPKEKGEMVSMQVPMIISASRSRKIPVF